MSPLSAKYLQQTIIEQALLANTLRRSWKEGTPSTETVARLVYQLDPSLAIVFPPVSDPCDYQVKSSH